MKLIRKKFENFIGKSEACVFGFFSEDRKTKFEVGRLDILNESAVESRFESVLEN